MKDILQEVDAVYRTISSIPVTDDSVDKMAIARAQLRKVYAELKKLSEEGNGDGDGV